MKHQSIKILDKNNKNPMWCLLLLYCALFFACDSREKSTKLNSIKMQLGNNSNELKLFTSEGKLFFDKSKYEQSKHVDFFLYTAHNSIWECGDLKDNYCGNFFLLNYFALMKKNKDSIDVDLINLALKKMAINRTIDFRTIEGQKLVNLIFCLSHGDINNFSQYFQLSTIPKMPFSREIKSDSIIDMKKILSLQKSSYFTEREFSDIIKDKTVIDQFSNLATLNGTLLLSVITSKNPFKQEMVFNEISIYYQFIENDELQIGKIDLNPYRKHIIE